MSIDTATLVESVEWYRQHLENSLINLQNLIVKHAAARQTARLLEDLDHLKRLMVQAELVNNIVFMASELADGAVAPSVDIPMSIERAYGD